MLVSMISGPVLCQPHSDRDREEEPWHCGFLKPNSCHHYSIVPLSSSLCRGLEGPAKSRFTFYCERFGNVNCDSGHAPLHVSLGCSSVYLTLPRMPPAVCPADYQVLVWSSQVTDQPPTEILFPSFPLLFLILFPLQPPSSLLSSFPFSPFSQHHKSSELFPGFHSSLCCWLLWPLFSTHSWLFICLDTAEIIPLEDNAHFIYFFSRQDWMFLCHAKCSTGLKIWFLAHLSWHR